MDLIVIAAENGNGVLLVPPVHIARHGDRTEHDMMNAMMQLK